MGKAKKPQKGAELHVKYVKANAHRNIPVGGFYGGQAPSSDNIHLSVYNDRIPFQEDEVSDVSAEGILLPPRPIPNDGKIYIEREIEATLVLSPENAVAMLEFLKSRVDAWMARKNQNPEAKPEEKYE